MEKDFGYFKLRFVPHAALIQSIVDSRKFLPHYRKLLGTDSVVQHDLPTGDVLTINLTDDYFIRLGDDSRDCSGVKNTIIHNSQSASILTLDYHRNLKYISAILDVDEDELDVVFRRFDGNRLATVLHSGSSFEIRLRNGIIREIVQGESEYHNEFPKTNYILNYLADLDETIIVKSNRITLYIGIVLSIPAVVLQATKQKFYISPALYTLETYSVIYECDPLGLFEGVYHNENALNLFENYIASVVYDNLSDIKSLPKQIKSMRSFQAIERMYSKYWKV